MKEQKMPQLKQDEQDYILKNRKEKTVPEIATHLKRGQATIYAYFNAKGWTPLRSKPYKRTDSHPFRKANVRLERFLIACKTNREV